MAQELADIVVQSIARLPPAYGDPIRMHYLEGAPQGEIAARLGLRAGCVRTRLHRGRQLLRSAFEACSPVDVLLRGDVEVTIRPMREEDIPALRLFDRESEAALDTSNEQRLPGNESVPGGP